MSYLAPSTSFIQSTERIDGCAISDEFQRQTRSPHIASIHVLDDDSLLNVFYLYRPFLWGEDQDDDARLLGGYSRWTRGRWWYKLVHVCRRWRGLILKSASYLDLCLVCTYGTPVADLLAHSPPLPLVIDYFDEYHDITPEDEERTILALSQRDRVYRVRLRMPIVNLRKAISAIDEAYPILEYVVITCRNRDSRTVWTFPETLQVPSLRHLLLEGFALPMGSQLLTAAVGLVTLSLAMVHTSTYFLPNTLLRWLSFMPQLETLMVGFVMPVPNRDVERQLMHAPIMTPVILPNLHCFMFQGVGAYLEALVHRIIAPRLEKFHIEFFNQLTFSIPRLLHFINTTATLRFKSAKFEFFNGRAYVKVYPREKTEIYALFIAVSCYNLDWQVSCVAQIFNSLRERVSSVEHLAFERKVHSLSSEEQNTVDRVEWHKLLGSFKNVKTLRVDNGLVEELSRCLQLDEGEPPLDALPELQELTYSRSGDTSDAFTSFVDGRKNAGRPVTLVRL